MAETEVERKAAYLEELFRLGYVPGDPDSLIDAAQRMITARSSKGEEVAHA